MQSHAPFLFTTLTLLLFAGVSFYFLSIPNHSEVFHRCYAAYPGPIGKTCCNKLLDKNYNNPSFFRKVDQLLGGHRTEIRNIPALQRTAELMACTKSVPQR